MKQKIADRFFEITSSETPSADILEKIQNKIAAGERAAQTKKENKSRKFVLKPVLAVLICAALVTAAVATAPFVLKMLGSDISFFDSGFGGKYSADQELIKQYSSEVGITTEGEGFSFTVDNIAYDGKFLCVFYTIKKEANIYEETKAQIGKKSDKMITQMALYHNEIYIEIPGYIELWDDSATYELLPDTLKYAIRDGYFASEHELKGMYRYTITQDLPDAFDIDISYKLNEAKIRLSVDVSESKVEKSVSSPDVSAVVTQRGINYAEGLKHDITIDQVSISPLGNVLTFTERGGSDEQSRELFSNFFIVDDLCNFYGKASRDINFRQDWEKDTSVTVEFYGDVPPEAKYLKLIPYNSSPIPEIVGGFVGDNPEDYPEPDQREYYLESKAHIGDLPYSAKQSEYGSVSIESCVVTEQDITVTYKLEGMVIPPFIVITDGESSVSPEGQLALIQEAAYNRDADTYTDFWVIDKPLKNAVNGLKLIQQDIELLQEQAIIVALR